MRFCPHDHDFFKDLLMRFNRDGFSRTAHEVFVSMSRDEFPCAPRKVLFFKRSQILLSHHILFCFSRPVFTQLSRFGLMFPSFLPAAFPLEREEVQTLRSAISSRTREVDGISLDPILGVSRENERHP